MSAGGDGLHLLGAESGDLSAVDHRVGGIPVNRSTSLSSLASAVILGLLGEPATAQIPHGQDRMPGPALEASEARARMVVPAGFVVELVASEPELVNPLAMTFDERGRIWVAESVEYPRRSTGAGRDRVKVLEDADGDGAFEKISVFADDLNLPSGIAVGHGGLWLAQAPDLLFLADDDGDGRADRREVVVTGFGREDTHELPNSLTFGPDGWLYGLNGVFNPSHVEQGDREWSFSAAVFRVHPRTRAFELFAEGTSNPWGIAFDDHGSLFVSACVVDHLWHIVESGVYERQAGSSPPFSWELGSIVQHGHQKAAYCGLHWSDSDAFPPAMRRRLLMGNIHAGCINVDVLEPRGASYIARGEADFLGTEDAWFMPVVQKTGLDGQLYVLDWYDRYHCYQDALRDPGGIDRGRGRLWRVRWEGAPRRRLSNLVAASLAELIGELDSGIDERRRTAERLLGERTDAETRAALESKALEEAAPLRQRRHALWARIASGALAENFVLQVLRSEDDTLRAWGVRAARDVASPSTRLAAVVRSLARDRSPRVALQVVIAAHSSLELDPVATILDAWERHGADVCLAHVAWQNLLRSLPEAGERIARELAIRLLDDYAHLDELLSRTASRLLAAESGGALVQLLQVVLQRSPRPARLAMLQELGQRLRESDVPESLRTELAQALKPLLADDPSWQAVLLLHSLGDPASPDRLRSLIRRSDLDERARIAALELLLEAENTLPMAELRSWLHEPAGEDGLRGQVLALLARRDDAQVASLLLEEYPSFSSALQSQVVELLCRRVDWGRALLGAIGAGRIPRSALHQGLVRRLLLYRDEELQELVTRHWGRVRAATEPEREAKMLEVRRALRAGAGDPLRGREVFSRVCAQCHMLYGEGQELAPDLTGSGRNSLAQLLTNVFDPSQMVGADYLTWIVWTRNGRILTGLLVENSERQVVLATEGDQREVVPRAALEELRPSPLSLMPDGLEEQLRDEELLDLIAYLILDRPPEAPGATPLPGAREVWERESEDPVEFAEILCEVAPGFRIDAVGDDGVALLAEHRGRRPVVRTHPVSPTDPCRLEGAFHLPENAAALRLAVSHHAGGDWRLVVRIDEQSVRELAIGEDTTPEGWADLEIDLVPFAGRTVDLTLENHATGWDNEYAYWGEARIVFERR